MNEIFDYSELSDFEKQLLDLANKKMPKETKKMLRTEGTKLKRKTLKTAKQKVNKVTGKYFKGIKRGKVYIYSKNGALSIRVYNNAPDAHLVEHGHRQVTKDGKEVGFVEGRHVFEDSAKEFKNEYFSDISNFLDNVLDEGLR